MAADVPPGPGSDDPVDPEPGYEDRPGPADMAEVPATGGIGGIAGAAGLGGLLESAQAALSAQARAAEEVVEGSAGGGVVAVEMTGSGEVRSLTLAPEVVDPDEIEMLQDLIVAALHDAAAKVAGLQREALGAFGNIDLGSLGGLGGLPGAGGPPGAGEGGR